MRWESQGHRHHSAVLLEKAARLLRKDPAKPQSVMLYLQDTNYFFLTFIEVLFTCKKLYIFMYTTPTSFIIIVCVCVTGTLNIYPLSK